MEKRPGLVHEPEKARPYLKPAINSKQHQAVIDSSIDVPEMEPVFTIPLNQVGIAAKTIWIDLPQGRLPFEAEVSVSLPAHLKGIHMSRIERAISSLLSEPFEDIRCYAEKLCGIILLEQKGNSAEVFLQGKLPHITKTAVSSEISLDSVTISVKTRGERENSITKTVSMLGLSLNHITACPCTQVYNNALFPDQDQELLFTHSQRSRTILEAEDINEAIGFHDIYDCLASCLHINQDLLKRPDEAELVLAAHRKPQFAEDVVRMAAQETAKRLGGLLPDESRIRIETLSMESIHIHNVKCVLECRMGDIRKRI